MGITKNEFFHWAARRSNRQFGKSGSDVAHGVLLARWILSDGARSQRSVPGFIRRSASAAWLYPRKVLSAAARAVLLVARSNDRPMSESAPVSPGGFVEHVMRLDEQTRARLFKLLRRSVMPSLARFFLF